MQKPKLTAIEKMVRRALFYRRLWSGSIFLLLLLLCGGLLLSWNKHRHRKENADTPNYTHLDESSQTYWSDRVEQDVREIRRLELSRDHETNRLHTRLLQTLTAAAAIPVGAIRNDAVYDATLAIFRNNIALNIDEHLEAMGETPLAAAMRARIRVSEALTRLRLNDSVAAAVAMNGYERMLTHYDVKLDSEPAELAFIGAVAYYRHQIDNGALVALFQKNLRFNQRISDPNLRMKAYRIIATEQARSGKDRDAMETTTHINTHLELVRAFQAIIINVAHPTKPDLNDPQTFQPKNTGPWEQPNPIATKRVINDVLSAIASHEMIDDQIDLLRRLAGSAMVCNPDLHTLLKSCLIESNTIVENVKRPIIRLLDEPESEKIRQAINKPSLTERRGIDTAIDDFTSTTSTRYAHVDATDPALVKGIIDLERIRIQQFIAQSYLTINRHSDAARCLQQTFEIAQMVPNIRGRVDLLIDIVGLQISAGDFVGSRRSFRAIGLPQRVDGIVTWEISSDDEPSMPGPHGESMETTLSRLARFKVLARYLNDAETAINLLSPGDARDEEYAFLAAELIRIQRTREASRVVGHMRETPLRTELSHRVAIARGGNEANYRALDVPFPEKTQQEEKLRNAAISLVQLGLFDAARNAVERMANIEHRSALSVRIIRNLISVVGSYGGEDSDHSMVRKTLFDFALRTANAIELPQERAEALELILSTMLSLVKRKSEQEALLPLIDQALEIAIKIPPTELAKAGIIARLLSAKVRLHAILNNRPTTWPLLDPERDQLLIEDTRKYLDEAIQGINEVTMNIKDDGAAHAVQTAIALGRIAIARVEGQIGRKERTLEILDSVLDIAKEMVDANKPKGVALYLATVPLFRALGDDAGLKAKVVSVYYDAFIAVDSVPSVDPTGGNARMLFGEGLRETEIDNLVRSLLENDFMHEATLFAERLTDATTRNRLLRIAAFRLLDKGDFASAENTAEKLSDPELRDALLRNIIFIKRQEEKD